MNRQIVYPGAIPLETDLLNTNKYSMLGLAKLASSLMGGNTYVHGLACTPSSPASMVVNVAAGQIYSLQNIDGTAYSSLPADTTHSILKQGYVLDAQQFTLTAPSTSGYSINYLIQATYADVDGGSTVLPYYNAANPSVAWSGPNNSGTSQYTVRHGVCTVSLKAGVAATTGTQVTPSPDSGCIGLYVITVAQGATTVTAGNIATYANAPFLPQGGIVDGIQRSTMTYAADTGVANAYVVNINPGILTLSDGMVVNFKATNANTTSSTLNVCSLGAFPVLNKFGQTLIAGEIASGSHVTVKWSASASSWLILDSTISVPTAPTAPAATNNTQIATTEFAKALPGRFLRRRFVTASGTFTPSSDAKLIKVRVIGGGGGGGAAGNTSSGYTAIGGGGGAGGYSEATITVGTGFTPVSVTVGAGGIPGGQSGYSGGAGGSSSFGSYCSASGGDGGAGTSATNNSSYIMSGGAGGLGSGGEINAYGQSGSVAIMPPVNGGISGAGGASIMSAGPGGRVGNASGNDGIYGSGASGGISQVSASTQYGGRGGAGIVIVEEYC